MGVRVKQKETYGQKNILQAVSVDVWGNLGQDCGGGFGAGNDVIGNLEPDRVQVVRDYEGAG